MARTKKLLLLVLIVLTLPAGYCNDKPILGPGAADDPLEVYGVVAGFVTIDDEPAANMVVTMTSGSSPSSRTETTNDIGYYLFQDVFPGTYTVAISGIPPDVEFETNSQTVQASGDTGGVDFEGFRRVSEPVTVDVLLFGLSAYPTAKFIEAGKEPGCDEAHWHSRDSVEIIARKKGSGAGFNCAVSTARRRSDPAQRECGHGKVEDVSRERITLDRSCLDAYIDMWGPLTP